jgi:hypothetical protein
MIPALVLLFILFLSIQAYATDNKPRQVRLSEVMEKASDQN